MTFSGSLKKWDSIETSCWRCSLLAIKMRIWQPTIYWITKTSLMISLNSSSSLDLWYFLYLAFFYASSCADYLCSELFGELIFYYLLLSLGTTISVNCLNTIDQKLESCWRQTIDLFFSNCVFQCMVCVSFFSLSFSRV